MSSIKIIKKNNIEKEPEVEQRTPLKSTYGVARVARVIRFTKRYDNLRDAQKEASRLSRLSNSATFVVLRVVKIVRTSGESLKGKEKEAA